MIGSLGGPALAGLFAPEGTELQSFRGHGSIDPVNMLHNTNTMFGRLGDVITDRAAAPISLRSSFVQQPTAFTGGGLPFPVGVSAADPALDDPSLLTLPGLAEFEGIFDNLVSSQNPDDSGFVTPDGYHRAPGSTSGDRRAQPRNSTMADNIVWGDRSGDGSGPRRPGTGVRTAQILDDNPLMPDGGDDLHQAQGAAQLMLEALSSGDSKAVIDQLLAGGVSPLPSRTAIARG